MVDCLKCISSACCRLKIEVDIKEYNKLIEVGIKDKMITYTDIFLKQNAKYKNRRKELDKMHKDIFAKVRKDDNGNCILLDSKMECSIYNNRPKVCKDYKHSRCKNIRD